MLIISLFCFLFFNQKTAYELRISDWSSDVCSSDLDFPALGLNPATARIAPLANLLPTRLREMVYTYGGLTEAAAPDDLGTVRSEAIAEWACRHYPRRQLDRNSVV